MAAVHNTPLKKEPELCLSVIFVSSVLVLFHLPLYFWSVHDGCVIVTTLSFDKNPE